MVVSSPVVGWPSFGAVGLPIVACARPGKEGTMKAWADKLKERLADAQERERLYAVALTPGPHPSGCQCPRIECTLRRLDSLPPVELTNEEREAIEGGGT